MIVHVESLLNDGSYNCTLRTSYLILINYCGTLEQKKEALVRSKPWIEQYPDDFNTYAQHIILIIKFGTLQNHQDTIVSLSNLLDFEKPLENIYILSHYLKLIRIVGSDEERRYVLGQVSNWLNNNFESYVLAEYLDLLERTSSDTQEIRARIGQWWEWIIKQEKVDKRIWLRFLKIRYQKASRDLCKKPINLALLQYPNDIHVLSFILRHFRELYSAKLRTGLLRYMIKVI